MISFKSMASKRIPRVIYRSWKTPSALTKQQSEALEYTQAQNPGWTQYVFWDADADAFMLKYYGEAQDEWARKVYQSYILINPAYGAARADVLRYAILFQWGGVWLDIKSSARKLDELIRPDDALLMSYWPSRSLSAWATGFLRAIHGQSGRGELHNWWLISEARHPLMRKVLDEVIVRVQAAREHPERARERSSVCLGQSAFVRYSRQGLDARVLRTTGPIMYSEVIERHRQHIQDWRLVASGDLPKYLDYSHAATAFSGQHRPGASYLNQCQPFIKPLD
jgi:hypothetical protein